MQRSRSRNDFFPRSKTQEKRRVGFHSRILSGESQNVFQSQDLPKKAGSELNDDLKGTAVFSTQTELKIDKLLGKKRAKSATAKRALLNITKEDEEEKDNE